MVLLGVRPSKSDSLIAALQQHASLTVAAVAVAAGAGIPLAVLAYRIGWLAGPILAAVRRALHDPVAGAVRLLGPILGLSFSTVLIGLVLYALLAIVRNALTGLRQVPRGGPRRGRRAWGTAGWACCWRVELPLALPSILTGLRLATVSTVALVTVGTLVGFGGFGNLILTGFNNNFYKPQIMTGTIGCVGAGAGARPGARRRRPAGHARGPGGRTSR